MANSISYASKYAPELDKMITQEAKTGFLADNAFKARFVGAKTVYLPEITLSGLGNYNRTGEDAGYSKGDVGLTHTPYTLSHERSKQLILDAQDADESGVPELAGKLVGEYTRLHVNPEIDAHNISALFKVAEENSNKVTYSADTAVKSLLECINGVEAANGYNNESLVAMVDPTLYNLLMTSNELQRFIAVSDFKQGEVNFKVKNINGCAIIPVAADRMRGEYTFGENGFTPVTDAANVRAVVMPKGAASFVKKVDKVDMYSPSEVQDLDAYKINFRLYYDLIVKTSQKNTIFAIG